MAAVTILLITNKLEELRKFYDCLGVELAEEKHGPGPVHFSFKSEVAMELYPRRPRDTFPIVLRFEVKDIQEIFNRATEIGVPEIGLRFTVIDNPIQTLFTTHDPDGRAVEVFQRKLV